MILYGSTTSPYVRKVRVAAIELGIGGQIELTPPESSGTVLNPNSAGTNPVAKVPTLIMEDGTGLFDSRIIMRYLDEKAGGSLYPAGDWAMQRRESIAEGMIDASLLVRFEGALRPEDKQWDGWVEAQSSKINGTLAALEAEADTLARLDAAAIGTACALGYLDFRFSGWGWRDKQPKLAAWFETFNQRPSMQATVLG